MILRHINRTGKYALKACKMARETVKLALIRRDNRRTRQFRFSSIQKEAGNTGIVGNKAATYCLIVQAASSVFEMFVVQELGDGRFYINQ